MATQRRQVVVLVWVAAVAMLLLMMVMMMMVMMTTMMILWGNALKARATFQRLDNALSCSTCRMKRLSIQKLPGVDCRRN